MKTIRKFLVKHFVLNYSITIFGKKFSAARASRILFPFMTIYGIIATQITPNEFNWYDLLFLISAIILLWVGFSWFGYSYFELFPINYNELDEKQKKEFKEINKQL